MATIQQAWASIDYTAGADIAAGGVCALGTAAVGIASYPIASGAVGGIVVKGVAQFAKGSGAINLGDALYWDATNGVATKTASTNAYIGIAAKAAASGDGTVDVLLNEGFVDTTAAA